MFNVVNLKKRRAVLFKRSRLITAFADALGILPNPGSDLRITNVSDATGRGSLGFQDPFRFLIERFLFKGNCATFKRFFIGGWFKVVSGKCFTNTVFNIGTDIFRWSVSLDASAPQLFQDGRDVPHPELNGAFGAVCQGTLTQQAIRLGFIEFLSFQFKCKHREIGPYSGLNFRLAPIFALLFSIHTIAEG